VGLVKLGRVYGLSHPLETAMPQMLDSPSIGVGDRLSIEVGSFDIPGANTRVFSDKVTLETHSGTHIDAFAHWSTGGRMYGGRTADESYAADGMRALGLENAPPIVTRGVLIDLAASRGADMLSAGTVLHPEDLQAALKRQGVALRSGDAALVRTGWAKLWDQPKRYMADCPGLSRRSAEWLADQGCVAVGADQWVIDADPPERPEDRRACHEVLLVERGVHIIENLDLEELARDGVSEFLFVAIAPPLKGGTGFPVGTAAIV
jgi:kynurenine formamidase